MKEEILQDKAAEALAELIYHCTARKPSPNDKLIKNICNLTCTDPRETPQAGLLSSPDILENQEFIVTSSSKHKSKTQMVASSEDRLKAEGFISRRGSELALKHLCNKFGSTLFDKLPKLWDCLTEILKPGSLEGSTEADEHIAQSIDCVHDPQMLINNIQVLVLYFLYTVFIYFSLTVCMRSHLHCAFVIFVSSQINIYQKLYFFLNL